MDNIKLHSKTNKYEKVYSTNYITLAQNVSQGPVLVNGVIRLLVPRNELFIH